MIQKKRNVVMLKILDVVIMVVAMVVAAFVFAEVSGVNQAAASDFPLGRYVASCIVAGVVYFVLNIPYFLIRRHQFQKEYEGTFCV